MKTPTERTPHLVVVDIHGTHWHADQPDPEVTEQMMLSLFEPGGAFRELDAIERVSLTVRGLPVNFKPEYITAIYLSRVVPDSAR